MNARGALFNYWGIPTVGIGVALAMIGIPMNAAMPMAGIFGAIVGVVWFYVEMGASSQQPAAPSSQASIPISEPVLGPGPILNPHQSAIMSHVIDQVAVGLRNASLVPLPLDQVLTMARDAAERILHDLSQINTDPFLEGTGDGLLAGESNDPVVHTWLEKCRADGVTDEDFRSWWNLCAFAREMNKFEDDLPRIAMFSFLAQEKGLSEKDAVTEVFRRYPKYGDPLTGEGDDRPLPVELKRRIVSYFEKHVTADPQQFAQRLQDESSLNALVRKEIQAGNL
jgi:hypothetical protein